MIKKINKIAVIDNYDSFTYNLVHILESIDDNEVDVFRNDEVTAEDLKEYQKIVLSPGPGVPDEAGNLKDIIMKLSPTKNILGVCLGLQALAEVFGGTLLNLNKVYHGVASSINIIDTNELLYNGIDTGFNAGRYHSWIVSKEGLPSCFKITSEDENGQIMSLTHNKYNLRGVQFHPESILTDVGAKIITNWVKSEC